MNTLTGTIIVSLHHRDWSCECVDYRIRLDTMPEDTKGGNHTFFIIEDKFEFMDHPRSRKVLADCLLSRYKGIPPRRMHLILYVTSVKTPHGRIIKAYGFERDENRQPVLKERAMDYSESTSMFRRIVF